jgi:hypothetical protein
VQASATAEDDAQQASSLAMQAKMMAVINRLQTTNAVQQSGGAPGSSAAPAHVPPPMPPQLFAAPERQQVVPGVKPPEARSDLVDLMRVVNDHIAAAMGVRSPLSNSSSRPKSVLTRLPHFDRCPRA